MFPAMKTTALKLLGYKSNWVLGLILLVISLIGIISCSKSEPDAPDNPTPPAVQDKLELAATVDHNPVLAVDGGTIDISFNASTSWTASAINDRADSWCSVSPTSGVAGAGKITVTVKENTEPDERSASVIIKAGTASETIKVTQKQKDALIITATKYEIPVEGGDFNVEIKSNVSYKYTISEDAKDWVTYVGTKALSTSTMTFSVNKNESVEGRSGSIIVGEGALCDTVKVYQAGETPAIVLSSKEYIAKSEGETFSVDVSSNVDVTTLIEYITENGTIIPDSENWLSECKTKTMSTNTYNFNVAQNEGFEDRYARIVFTNKGVNLSDTVFVRQHPDTPAIILSQKEFTIPAEGKTILVDVTSNLNLASNIEYIDEEGNIIDNYSEWLVEIKTKVMTTNSYSFRVAQNESFEDRYARIIFANNDNNTKDTVNIIQFKMSYINILTDNINIGDEGGEIEIQVDSNIDYDIVVQKGLWINPIDKSDNEKNRHYFIISPNNTDSTRVGHIICTSDIHNCSDTLVVSQEQYNTIYVYEKDKNVKISSAETVFSVRAEVTMSANLQNKIICQDKWLEETHGASTKGRGGLTLYFKAKKNISDSTRNAQIIIYDANNPIFSDTVRVEQLSNSEVVQKNFKIEQKEFIVPLEGCRIALPIEHDGAYYIHETDKNFLIRINDIIYEGETDYVFYQVGESDSNRESKIIVWDKTHSISDTVIVRQQQTDEYLHGEMGQIPQSITYTVPYTGGLFDFKIFTNLSNYKIIQIPSKYNLRVEHYTTEKKDYGFLEVFEVPKNSLNFPEEINLAFIGDNVTFMLGIRISNKLTIEFESSEDMLIPYLGGQFSTSVWTNDDNLNIRIEGENTEWLRIVKNDKNSSEDYTRIISVFEALPNNTGKQREAYIVAYNDNGFGETEKVRVVQPSGGSILLSESLNYLGAWEQIFKAKLIDCNYKVTLESGNDWVNIGQSEKQDGKIIQNLKIAVNTANMERSATVVFTSDTIANKMTLIQLPESDALVDSSPQQWRSFQLPKVNFKAPYPESIGTMIYNAIVKDPEFLIEVESRKVLEQLYFSPDEPLIPRRDEIEYVLDNYDGISAFYSSGRSSGIKLSYQYVESYYKQYGVKKLVEENRGVLSHELTHSFQLTPKGVGDYSNPIYHACIEGMADAVRVLTGHFTDADRPKGGSYLDSYRYTGFFIAWLVKNKDKDFLRKFNMSTQYLDVWSFDGAVKYALGQQYNVDDLWKEYQKAMGDPVPEDKDITTFQQMLDMAHSFTKVYDTPMGKHYSNRHVTTDNDREWLLNPENEPSLLLSADRYTWRKYDVNLYPFGSPVPADANQRGVGDCSAIAVLAEMAYLFPDFIKSIITDHNDGTYTVAMFDPQGKPVKVRIKSTFLGDDNGLGACAGKDGKATWATILEKAIMKWNYIYQVNPDIAGIGSEHVAPLFTGEGDSFAFSPNDLTAKQLDQVVDIALENNMIVIGGFNKAGLSVNGPTTVTAHAYSFMYSTEPDALFAMRNPWGHNDGEKKGQDGLLHIVNDGIVPRTIDLRIIYPGAAEPFVVKDLQPYTPPQYTTKMIFNHAVGKLVQVQ